jgi:hypothetical protein
MQPFNLEGYRVIPINTTHIRNNLFLLIVTIVFVCIGINILIFVNEKTIPTPLLIFSSTATLSFLIFFFFIYRKACRQLVSLHEDHFIAETTHGRVCIPTENGITLNETKYHWLIHNLSLGLNHTLSKSAYPNLKSEFETLYQKNLTRG